MLYKPSINRINGKTAAVFRRDHLKQDGRLVHLYGFRPHQGQPLDELLRNTSTTPELRHDPLRNTWAMYAPHRQSRTFKPSSTENPLAPATPDCPATEIAFEEFELAIFENRFPCLTPNNDGPTSSPWATGHAFGQCDVVVYTSEASGDLNSIGQERRVLLIEALVDRYQSLYEKGFSYVLPFENRGDQVGVTLAHPHGQIYAFDRTPGPQESAARAFHKGYDLIGHHESWDGQMDITSHGDLVAFCPAFGRYPYETWIMPRFQCAGPWELRSGDVKSLAYLLGDITRRLDKLFDQRMPYMMSFQAAPRSASSNFQFTVQFLPILRDKDRLKYFASVEHFTGIFTVDIAPETAAKNLRMQHQ